MQQHRSRRQLPRVAPQEELAERAIALHQEHYGPIATNLLTLARVRFTWA